MIEAKLLHESQGEPRGERDVIRLRNPTEDKRAFRRMLTSADLLTQQTDDDFFLKVFVLLFLE